MKQAFIYSTKIWLTTVVLGMRVAGIIKILMDKGHLIYSLNDVIASAIYDIPIGLMVCLPSWSIFAVIVRYCYKTDIELIYKRCFLSVAAIFLGVLPFAILFWHQLTYGNYLPDMLPELIGYIAVTVAGIWIYNLKSTKEPTSVQVN